MRQQYQPRDAQFWQAFLQQEQQGGGFIGQPYQRGAGIGSFFRSLFRMAAPVLKRAAKAVGKQVLKTGADVVVDVARGGDLAPTLEAHGREALASLAERSSKRIREAKQLSDLGVEDQGGSGLGKRKAQTAGMSINQPAKKRKSRSKSKPRTKQDIFG
jgi:hypothetical protein